MPRWRTAHAWWASNRRAAAVARVAALLISAGALSACKRSKAPAPPAPQPPADSAADGAERAPAIVSRRAELPAPDPDTAPATAPAAAAAAGTAPAPSDAPAAAPSRQISVPQLVALLKSGKELRGLTLDTAGGRFAGLVPAFVEKTKDDERWEFEGVNERGLIRNITLTFVPSADDAWVFRSVSVRLHSDEPTRTFQQISHAANAALKRPRWLDLSARDRSAWSLGGGWELVAAVLDDGDVHLRAGPSGGL